MTHSLKTTFKITGWDEEVVWEETDGNKLSRAKVSKSYEGNLNGQGTVEYLTAYKAGGSATFSGFEKVNCELNGISGSFVFEHRGIYKDGVVQSIWAIVEGSGTGQLENIQGAVDFTAGHQAEYEITFTYDL